MPPKRRTKSTPSTQQTLAFGTRNKVTKPAAPLPASKKKLKPSPLSQKSDSQTLSTTSALEEDETDDAEALQRQRSDDEEVEKKPSMLPKSPGGRLSIRKVKSAAAPARSEVEERAAKVSDAELKRYWRAQEEERKAKRGVWNLKSLLLQRRRSF